MSEISLGLIASQRSWRTDFQAHARDHVGGIKVKILREPRMALEEELDVIVIDDVSTFLTRSKVLALRERGVRVVGIFDPKEGLGEAFLQDLGVDMTLPCTMSPEEMIRAISTLEPQERLHEQFNEVVSTIDLESDVPTEQQPNRPALRGRVIAIGGPGGAGTTEIAIALADALGRRGERALLVDVDEVAPSAGRRLCYLLHPNILTAMEITAHQTRALRDVIGKRTEGVSGSLNFDAIPGIANVDDWVQLREHEIADLLSATTREWHDVVVNTGPHIEDLSGVGLDRYSASRTALAGADTVIGVCAPTPLGILQFLDWLSQVRTLGRTDPVWVVVNKVPTGLFGRTEKGFRDLRGLINKFPGATFHKAEIEEAIRENVDERLIAGVIMVPFDDHVSTAMWEGRPVDRGPFTKIVTQLADFVAPSFQKMSKLARKQAGSTKGGPEPVTKQGRV